MKLIRFVAFLFYRYYSGGKRPDSIPLFRTFGSMTLLGFLHVMQILILFHSVDLIPTKPTDNIWQKRLGILTIMLPIFILLNLIIKKKDLEEMKNQYEYNWDKILNANVWLIVYIIISFALTIVLSIITK